MASIQNDKLKFDIKNISSLYSEFDYINKDDDIGMYEAFDCMIKIGDSIILNKNLELCSGNIKDLLQGINDVLINNISYTEVEFCEPDLAFDIKKITDNRFLLKVWLSCYVIGDKSHDDNEIGLQFDLSRGELLKFRNELQEEWDGRKKIMYDKFHKYENK